jgi:hypothetical protein
MAILAILILGALAPFIIIYGAVFGLLAFPLWMGASWAWPYWARLPLHRRRQLRIWFVWVASIVCWTVIIVWSTNR